MLAKTDKRNNSSDDDSERSLLVQISAGDRLALRTFYFLYHRRLQRFLNTLSHDTVLMEEIVNDTLLAVWRSAGNFRGDSRVSTWVFGIAYRRALKTLQRAAGRHDKQPLPASPESESGIDATALDFERSNWIGAALAQLSLEHRMVVELTYFLGLSCDEVSAVVGCPIGTVKTRLHHARLRLRRALEQLENPQPLKSPRDQVAL
jgi:RNA polymerase sigma-70 factor, ECF subfamily